MNLFRRKPSTTVTATTKEPAMPIRTSTYSFLHDPDPPSPAPEPVAMPDSALMAESKRILAKCEELARDPEIVRHVGGNQPLGLVRLTAAAHNLRLQAVGFGTALDQAAAALADAAAASLEQAWIAGSVAPPPPPPPPPARVPAEDFGVHTAGRPFVGQVLHLDSEEGICRVCWVVEIMAGRPAESVSVTAENPYIRVAPVENPTRPVFARWVPKPVKCLSPGYKPVTLSWHRPTPSECGGFSE